jgi:hypothetical protein
MTIINGRRPRNLASILLLTAIFLLISSCAVKKESVIAEEASLDLSLLQSLPKEEVSYENEVRPVLQRRCVVCHGCYDAPCQLKLSSPAGIQRGASKQVVYKGSRFKTMAPTRLYIDEKTTEGWRERDFHSVLNEGTATASQNLDQSVMYKMLRLKKMNPQAQQGRLADEFDLSLNRKQTCPTLDEFDSYASKKPNQGMPFAMPNLSDEEYRIITQWLAQGAPVPADKQPSATASTQIKRWESFLNGAGNKQKLVSRYIYEHLFYGHMHFKGTNEREFYRLVRSTTPSGQAVDEIATVRPYDDPGATFYYRLQRFPGDIVAKTHVVYELSDERLERYRELFIAPDYPVAELPSYEPTVAANPFKAYKDIPPRSRYQFMLDDARYFIEGFMKGPVCRGMIALNVIEDQFWVTFLNPDLDEMLAQPETLGHMADYLAIPSEQGGNISLLGSWKKYRKLERQYVQARFEQFSSMKQVDLEGAMDFLWDGDGSNPNAALTVFRHYDSASVSYGFTGAYPETAWVIDYPLLERIHYMLVAGFNVFGNLKHQLTTRLYMDFLRMEGEDMYLAFLPTTHRKAIRDNWYQGMRAGMDEEIRDNGAWITKDVVTGYKTDDPQRELYQVIERKLANVLKPHDVINRCEQPPCHAKGMSADKRKVDAAMRRIAGMRGQILATFPDVAFIRVRRDNNPDNDLAYTVIRNKAYKNVTSMFADEEDTEVRDYSNDTVTVVDWLEGSYPNFFFTINIDDIDRVTQRYADIRNREDYENFVSIYGTRRTDSTFWSSADWFQDKFLREKPINAGLLDLNRYENR